MRLTPELPRRLRRRSTLAERLLWGRLRDRRMNGRKWRRQYRIDQYVLDFYCPELRLAVELDGAAHVYKPRRDRIRQAYLENQAIRVVRFRNRDVLGNLEGVTQSIWELTVGPEVRDGKLD